MFRREEVKFRSHTVLKATMLSLSCKAPMEYMKLQYSGWADGLLCGAEIIVGDNELTVQPGIILYQGNMFRMTESTQISYKANGRTMKLRLHFGECKETEAGKFYEADLSLTEETERRAGDMELVRFCLQEGAELRDQFKNFEDIGTQFNTLNYMLDLIGMNKYDRRLTDLEKALYNDWVDAKTLKDFVKADEIRKQLIEKGIL